MLGGLICVIVGIVLGRAAEVEDGHLRIEAEEYYLLLVRGGLLLVAGLLGCFGGLCAFRRRRRLALALLLIATFAPLLFQFMFILLTFPCLISAGVTVAIRPRLISPR